MFVVGDIFSSATGTFDWFALKYSAAAGDVLWGPVAFADGQPFGAASDPAGNLVATGSGPGGMTTIKFSGVDGSVAWGPKVIGSVPSDGRAILVDGAGNVFAAGDAVRPTSGFDLAIVKCASADGSVLWGPRYFDGEAHSFDIVYDLGLGFDGSGGVVLGGTTRRPSNYQDLVALKYDAATGATLWGPVYAGGPGDQSMYGFGVRGNLVVAGAPNAGAFLIQAWSEAFGIATAGPLSPAFCGIEFSFSFSAANGTTPYTWSIAGGALPAGMALSSTGILSGTPAEEGLFTFTVHVSDASAASASREFTLFVQPPPDQARISVSTDPTCESTLSVAGGPWTAYLWLPGGETTPTIAVRPTTATTYGVLVTDSEGCIHRGALTLPGYPLVNPSCDAPTISSVSPGSGSAAGGVSLTIDGANFDPAAVVHVGGVDAPIVSIDSGEIVVTSPALTPGTANDVLVLNPSSANAALLKAFFADFLDVPAADPFHDDIARLVKNGITAGCGAGNYCPTASVTRAQMAVFLLKSNYGSSHVPPPAVGVFNDVPTSDPFAPWIEELASLGVTAGCGNGNYCPSATVTRAQMAVFLLKTRNGSSYAPPPATGIFGDVPASDPFAPWIEQIYLRGHHRRLQRLAASLLSEFERRTAGRWRCSSSRRSRSSSRAAVPYGAAWRAISAPGESSSSTLSGGPRTPSHRATTTDATPLPMTLIDVRAMSMISSTARIIATPASPGSPKDAQPGRDDDERRARHARDALRRHHEGEHHEDLGRERISMCAACAIVSAASKM